MPGQVKIPLGLTQPIPIIYRHQDLPSFLSQIRAVPSLRVTRLDT
jgi:hypothetical protein